MNNQNVKLSVCAIMKDEASYLEEWLEFHKIIGVEKFYLYNNNSTDNTLEIIQPYIESGEVICHDWPFRPGQMGAYEHCLQSYGKESEWMAFIDLDEFLFPSEEDDLKIILDDFKDYPAVVVNWLTFGSSGHLKKPEGLQIENFTKRAKTDFANNYHVKSIVRPDQTLKPRNPHYCQYIEGSAVTENKQPVPDSFSKTVSVKRLRINHYTTRSKEEFDNKTKRGRADTAQARNPGLFKAQDRNDIEDLTIQRFLPQLRKALAITKIKRIKTQMQQWQTQLKKLQSQLHTESRMMVNNDPFNIENRAPNSQNKKVTTITNIDLNEEKVFGIGLSRTGTLSLTKALIILGYKTAHWTNPITKKVLDTEDVYFFNALLDVSISYRFEELYYQFPRSKFIYTVRDEKNWVESLTKHYGTNHNTPTLKQFREFLHQVQSVDKTLTNRHYEELQFRVFHECIYSDYKTWVEAYQGFSDRVYHFFSNKPKERFLVMNITEGDRWDKLCPFLGKEIPQADFPHAHKLYH